MADKMIDRIKKSIAEDRDEKAKMRKKMEEISRLDLASNAIHLYYTMMFNVELRTEANGRLLKTMMSCNNDENQ